MNSPLKEFSQFINEIYLFMYFFPFIIRSLYLYLMRRNQLVVLHVTFWGLLFISNVGSGYLNGAFSGAKNTGEQQFIRHIIIQAGYITIPITCFYFSYFLVAPELFIKKRYVLALFYAFLTLTAIVVLRYLLEYYFFKPVLGFDNYKGHPWPVKDYVENIFFYYFPRYFVYGLMYFFAESWYRTQHLQQSLEKEKSAAELAFLRSQLNPHFLFNTINDIYSLTYQKSEQAPEALLKLAELLRYMLRESNEDFMPLSAEVQYLENLVELQRISAKGKAYVIFDIDGLVSTQKLASLLLVSFVENAFKHGVLNDTANPVHIRLSGGHKSVEFSVHNRKNNNSQKDQTGGIGLNNVRRRLELLYPRKHRLQIDETHEFYTVNLVLQTDI
jgi:two-component system LytT family sensor kinase